MTLDEDARKKRRRRPIESSPLHTVEFRAIARRSRAARGCKSFNFHDCASFSLGARAMRFARKGTGTHNRCQMFLPSRSPSTDIIRRSESDARGKKSCRAPGTLSASELPPLLIQRRLATNDRGCLWDRLCLDRENIIRRS